MEVSMKYNKQILSVLFAALAFGALPQAQGMGYFKNAYKGVSAFAQKVMASASAANSLALARISAIVNHIMPNSEIKTEESAQPQLVLAGKNLIRLGIIKNHLNPHGDAAIQSHNCSGTEKTAIKRAHIIANHLAPEQDITVLNTNNCAGKDDLKDVIFENQIQSMLMWFYNDATSSAAELIGPEIDSEEIFDTDNNKIGTIYFHRKNENDESPLITRFVNNKNTLIGFSIASVNSITKAGAISYLHINQSERRSGLGKVLLAYVTRKLYQFGCVTFHGTASTFDLPTHENEKQMQTKLEGFYGQFGAESINGNKSSLALKL